MVFPDQPGRKAGVFKYVAGFTQGTTYHITYKSKKQEDLKPLLIPLLDNFDMSLSIYNDQSVISRFNRNDPDVKADEMFTEVFRQVGRGDTKNRRGI